MDLTTANFERPRPSANKFRFFMTGRYDFLVNGFDIDLDLSFSAEKCKNFILNEIKKRFNIGKADLLIYVSGGIPFLQGTLGSVYSDKSKAKHYIYGVLTYQLSTIDIDNNYYELCNINDDTRITLLSPVFSSSTVGLCNIACLLGYLNHDGSNSSTFLHALATSIHFPPLITSLSRVIDHKDITGRDIITITSTLSTFFRWMISDKIDSKKVLEYCLKCSNFICQISNIPETLPISQIEINPSLPAEYKFLEYLFNKGTVYLWEEDYGKPFKYVNFKKKFSIIQLDQSYEIYRQFTPILPLSIRTATGCSIVKGSDHNFLYLKQSSSKDSASQNNVDIINPKTGICESVNLTKFAKEQSTKADYINPNDKDNVKQIIYVCFDTSSRMKNPIFKDKTKKEIPTRSFASTQFLTIFANRLFGYRINCFLGLITFNKTASIALDPTPFTDEFESQLINPFDLKYFSGSIQAASLASDELQKFSEFKNAAKRIILITAGNDMFSIDEATNLAKKLFQNKIVLDLVAFGDENDFKELITLSRITGGLAVKISSVSDGLSLFEKSAFLDINERDVRPYSTQIIPGEKNVTFRNLDVEKINNEFIQKGASISHFDTEIRNKYIFKSQHVYQLATPSSMVAINKNNADIRDNYRIRRILRELHYISQIVEEGSEYYDDNLKVFPYRTNLDNWIVFLKGEEGTIYQGKWFKLLILFPDLYPVSPPIIRFTSIPYHLNISSEGRICLNILDKGYMENTHVYNIIQEIKEVFVLPNIETPVQIEILETFLSNKDLYYEKAKKSVQSVGKDDFNQFLENDHFIYDKKTIGTNVRFVYDDDSIVPLYMISQVSGRRMREPILASTGVYYDREELRQIISTNRNPICVVTGRMLTDSIDSI